MKFHILFPILFLYHIAELNSQVIPYGLYIDVDGKVKFWEAEANKRGYIVDSVITTCGSEKYIDDIVNLKYDQLTVLEFLDEDWTMESSGDPSRINDTTSTTDNSNLNGTIWSIPIYYDLDTIVNEKTKQTKANVPKLDDIIRGSQLSDSVVTKLKVKLTNFIHANQGIYMLDEIRNGLHEELSHYDTVIEQVAIYDYLVDHLVFYTYEKNKLKSAIGYHWSLGVEIDSLQYDKKGRLIYFSRESIGTSKHTYCFTYDKKGRVNALKTRYSFANYEGQPFVEGPTSETKYTYNKEGVINSKSILLEDGSWNTCYFEIK